VASINRLNPILAIAVGVLHAGLGPIVVVAGVKPNLALVASVLVATSVGFAPGVTWAFVAGLTANVLGGDALGSIPLSLLAAVGVAAVASPLLGRVPFVWGLVAVFAGSLVADAVMLLIQERPGGDAWPDVPLQIVLTAAAVNAGIAALVLVPARLLARRRSRESARP
jgi:hypothetical protein